MRNKFEFLRLLILVTGFWILVTAPLYAQQTYPQLDISGFKKWEYKKVDVDPMRNYFSGLTQLGGFYPTFTGGPWQERLQLRILGQLSENLSVTYDLEQQPETPERYDVKVKYFNNELTFGDFTANFTGNEFASTSKFLNGVMFTAKDSWYDVIAVPSAKLKSQTQQLTSQKGNNTRGPYSLGHGSIVEGSERIELNNNLLTRNVDYTIDYFEGKVTFNRILTQVDEFKYSYEYTNILDLFFPALSKRDFFGFQSRFTIDPEEFGKPAPKPEPVVDSARDSFPSQGTVEPEVLEEEASGLFRLKNIPVVMFSEKLTFMGTELKKNEDYIIRYDQGSIKLLTRFLPTSEEALTVEYKYYKTAEESEFLPGIGSRGSYKFSHRNLVPESERIEVDGKLFVRDLDYTILYDTGEITFGIIIGPTSQIKAVYKYNEMAIPTPPPSRFPRELKIGTTYLRESAKKSAASAYTTVTETFTGAAIIGDNYQINLQNHPITTAESGATLLVSVDGRIITQEVDYAVPATYIDPSTGYVVVTPEAALPYVNDRTDLSDGYDTGTIKFLNTATVTPTSQVSVTYTYYKSIVGRYSGVGDGTRGPYYLRNVRNIVPGTETVQVWEQGSSVITTYTRNSSYEADAGATGYSINYSPDNPSITFNNPLGTTKNFQLIYQYVPPKAYEGGDISQSVFGFDGSFKVGEAFKIDAAYAKSEADQVFTATPTTEIFNGNGSKTYTLNYLNDPSRRYDLVDGSEKVYINGNLRNKDLDYYISYSNPGQITFYYTAPSTADAIQVDYEYKKPLEVGGESKRVQDTAFRLGAETKLFGDVLTLSGNTKQIGFDFSPMGGTAIGSGSKYKEYDVKLNPEFHSLTVDYSYKENENPISTYRDRFLRNYDNSIGLGINPNSLAQIDFSYRNFRSLDDLLPAATTYNSDSLQESYSLGVTPAEWKRGQLTFNHKYDLRRTFSQADTKRDSSNFSETNIDYYRANGSLKFTERLTAGYDLQFSEPKTVALKTSTVEATAEAVSSHQQSIDTSYTFQVDLTPGFLEKWTARVSLLNQVAKTLARNFSATDEVITTKNETYHTDLVPVTMLTTSLDHNRQETSSVVVGGTNPKTERTSATARLIPYSWISGGGNWSQSESIPETGLQNRTTGRSNAYDLDYKPFTSERFSLSADFSISDSLQTAPSGTSQEVATNTNTFSQIYGINLLPHPNAPTNLSITIENYRNKNDHPIPDSQIDTETENQTFNAGVNLTITPSLSLNSNYNLKITKVLRDLRITPQEPKKTLLDNKLTYLISNWGTLVYGRQDEKNEGEIQAGAVSLLNIEKTTQTLSLSINLPVDNPVVTSFVITASLKSVDYKNLANPSDDFRASLTTFEGTLNF